MLELVVGGLATWRLTRMALFEEGPFDIFARFRAWAARKELLLGLNILTLTTCLKCMSVWIGSVAALWLAGDVLWWILYTLSFSAITIVTEALTASKKA